MTRFGIGLAFAALTLGVVSFVPREWMGPVAIVLIVVSYVSMRALAR